MEAWIIEKIEKEKEERVMERPSLYLPVPETSVPLLDEQMDAISERGCIEIDIHGEDQDIYYK